jgi:hypothetical protein
MTVGAAFIQLLSAAIAGGLGGWFVLLGVNAQFRRQSEAALRALFIEVEGNASVAAQMVGAIANGTAFEAGKPNPSWLRRGIWDSQLPLLSQILDHEALRVATLAYSSLEVVRQMPRPALSGAASAEVYSHGGWIDIEIVKIRDAFKSAENCLVHLIAEQDRQAGLPWTKKLSAQLHRLVGRSK